MFQDDGPTVAVWGVTAGSGLGRKERKKNESDLFPEFTLPLVSAFAIRSVPSAASLPVAITRTVTFPAKKYRISYSFYKKKSIFGKNHFFRQIKI